jgi:Flp pilus assembly protein TadD
LPEAVAHFREAIRLNPRMAIAHNDLALALAQMGRPQEVIDELSEAVRLAPERPEAFKNLAWALTTCPDRSLRNAAKAVELAQRAVELSDPPKPEFLDCLAAAYAEAGRFPEAAQTARKALDLATQQNNVSLAESVKAKIPFYEAGAPVRDAQQTSAPQPGHP